MKKKFLINIILLLVLNLLIKPFWVIAEIQVQNTIGTVSYGLYFALFNLSFVFYMILDVGVTNFNSKELAGSPILATKFISKIIPLKLSLGLLYIICLLATGLLLNYNKHAILLLTFLGFNQFLIAFLAYMRSNLQGLHYFKSDSIISVSDRIVMIALILYLLQSNYSSSFSIEWFIFIQTAGFTISITLASILLFYHSKIKPKFHFDLKFSILFLKKSLPYTLLGVLMLLYGYTDSILLERTSAEGASEAGIYAQSSRILQALASFAFLFSALLLPIFARVLSNKENPNELIQFSGALLIISSIFIATSSAYFSEEIISFLYGKKNGLGFYQKLLFSFNGNTSAFENYSEIVFSADVFRLCILSFIPISITYIYGTFLTAAGEMKILNISSALAVVISIGLNLLLIPYYGVKGVALVSLITQCLVCTMQVVYARKKYQLKISYILIIRYFASLSIFVLILYLLKYSSLNWLEQIIIACSIGLLSAIISKAIPLPHVSKLLKFKEN